MHSLGSSYSDTSSLSFPRYQGFGTLATPFSRPPGFGLTSQSIPTFTSSFIVVIRQQMDESNHEMVHMLTQQMGTILRPLIQDSTHSCQQLATQMTRIKDFLGAPRAQVCQNPAPPPRPETLVRQEEMTDDTAEQEHREFEHIQRMAQRPPVTEFPRGWKVPKFAVFIGDTEESTLEHVARYQTEVGDIDNNEDLKLKYFPSSLTKNAFTWFTVLPPQSIQTWTQLERLFHEQFYMGQSKISLKELASVKQKVVESVDQYLNRFRLLKARCFTQVPEHELVEMADGGLDYSIRKKLDTQYLRDMAQLADRVRLEGVSSDDEDIIDKSEVNVEELKPGTSYACKVLKPSNGKNLVEPEKIDKYVAKTYTFDVSKDLVQKALKEGRLQFGERPKMQVDSDPLKIEEALYVEPLECMVVETTDGLIEVSKADSLAESFEVMMV
ncbi:uncharacterized protein LOC127137133 [Lathyrus oleraceus]|uniref:uncharacterized protein LOC127137133 n=1 Tax=Pisum sativum TaxID=3888 RepID=UPI0021CE24BD|nr:uncharacterized protein LOC127137133 [Pisum sativum]